MYTITGILSFSYLFICSMFKAVERDEYVKLVRSSLGRVLKIWLLIGIVIFINSFFDLNITPPLLALIGLYILIGIQDCETTIIPFTYSVGIFILFVLHIPFALVKPEYLIEVMIAVTLLTALTEFLGDKIDINFGLGDIHNILLSIPLIYYMYTINPYSLLALLIGISLAGTLMLIYEVMKLKKRKQPLKSLNRIPIPFCHILSVGYIMAIIVGSGDWFY